MNDELNSRFIETMNDHYDKYIMDYIIDTAENWADVQYLTFKAQTFDWLQEYDSFIMWFDKKREAL